MLCAEATAASAVGRSGAVIAQVARDKFRDAVFDLGVRHEIDIAHETVGHRRSHILYTFKSGAWFALDGVYFSGARTNLKGMKSDNEQRNTWAGFTVALPIDRQISLELSASTGITTRTGSEFTAVGAAWQYHWGEGY